MFSHLNTLIKTVIIIALIVFFLLFSALWYFSSGLPDYKKLSNYQSKIFHPIELIAKAYGIKEIGNEKYSLSKIQN